MVATGLFFLFFLVLWCFVFLILRYMVAIGLFFFWFIYLILQRLWLRGVAWTMVGGGYMVATGLFVFFWFLWCFCFLFDFGVYGCYWIILFLAYLLDSVVETMAEPFLT